jgi:hypothetical protein
MLAKRRTCFIAGAPLLFSQGPPPEEILSILPPRNIANHNMKKLLTNAGCFGIMIWRNEEKPMASAPVSGLPKQPL